MVAKASWTRALVVSLFAAGGLAVAGPAAADDHEPVRIDCGSSGYNYTRCSAPGVATVREVRLVNQRSSTTCTENDTWGYDRAGVWVDKGCRATFLVYPFASDVEPETIRCNSGGYDRKFCPPASGAEVFAARLQRQRSSTTCTFNRTWGFDSRGVWVDDGCRADFVVNDPTDIGRFRDLPDDDDYGRGPRRDDDDYYDDDDDWRTDRRGPGAPGRGGRGGWGDEYTTDPYRVASDRWYARGLSQAEIAIAACSRRVMRAAWEDADYAAMFSEAPRVEDLTTTRMRSSRRIEADWRVSGPVRVHNARGFLRYEVECYVRDDQAVEFFARPLR